MMSCRPLRRRYHLTIFADSRLVFHVKHLPPPALAVDSTQEADLIKKRYPAKWRKKEDNMKKLRKETRYVVVRTRFHGGGIVSCHTSLEAAVKAAHRTMTSECVCGCAHVVSVTSSDLEAFRREVDRDGYAYGVYIGEPFDVVFANLSDMELCESPYTVCL